MTTAAKAISRPYQVGDHNDIGVVATDIIYEGSAVGENGSGYARPLVAGDLFLGWAQKTVDNSTGSAGDKNVRTWRRREIQLPVTSALITDIGRPVYASDDNTFNLTGIGTKIGYAKRFVSAGVLIVDSSDAPESIYTIQVPITLTNVADGDILTTLTPGHHGRVKKIEFAVGVPVTTAAKASTFNVEIGVTNITGGTVALTSANATPRGAIVAMAPITALAAFQNDDTISIEASSTTAFIEGDGFLNITLGN